MPIITVTPHEAGLTLLELLQRHAPTATPAYLRQLLKGGKVTTTNGPCHADIPVVAGQILRLPESERLIRILAETQPLTILFETREILVVAKPAGLAVHAAVGHEVDNLTTRAEALLKRRRERFQIAPIHRLDLETSGPLLFGKGRAACGELGKLFMNQEVVKLYMGLARGRTPHDGEFRSLVPAKGTSKEAHTAFSVLEQNDRASLLSLHLFSGRQHQIRRQLADCGHPLFGDRRYGGPCPGRLSRLFLHCRTLSFVDPFSGASVTVHAPLPEELAAFLPDCGLHSAD